MTKKVIFGISVAVNIILALVLIALIPGAVSELHFEYVEQETIRPDTVREYLEWENYGTVAALARPVRGGAEVGSEYEADFRVGEYAELKFLHEIYSGAGRTDTARACEERMSVLRGELFGYGDVLDEIDKSVADAAVR